MDWNRAIDRNTAALVAIVTSLCALIRMADLRVLIDPRQRREFAGGVPQQITRAMRLKILRLLRPAEAAARRLVLATYLRANGSWDEAATPNKSRVKRPKQPDTNWKFRPAPLPLFDPEKHYGLKRARKSPRHLPRILFPLQPGFQFKPARVLAPPQLGD